MSAVSGISAGKLGSRLPWIDALTVASSVGVVFLHCNLAFWGRPAGFRGCLSNAIECVFYFCVPVFFMISGYTLLGFRERYGTGRFLCRRISRAVIPFLFWSFVAWIIAGGGGFKGLLLSVANSTAMPIYWFFPHLFGCYAAILVLSYAQDKLRLFSALAALIFLTNSLLPFLGKVCGFEISRAWQWPLGPELVLFVLLGYVLGSASFGSRMRWLIYVLGMVGFGVHFCCTWRLSPVGGPIDMTFKGYLNWPSVFYSASVFVAGRQIDWGRLYGARPVARVLDAIKGASLSIYLLHGFFVYFLIPKSAPRFFGESYGASVWYSLTAPFLITASCVAIHYLLRRIPVIRRTLG